ncbi:MAG: hypothetical protein HQK76_20770 [Desulfobacterales bacterium]|nr:hypothetical protein [Desulfobacterales bacterium]
MILSLIILMGSALIGTRISVVAAYIDNNGTDFLFLSESERDHLGSSLRLGINEVRNFLNSAS